jgi:hypothetical protein
MLMKEGEGDVGRQHLLPTALRYVLFLDFETKFLENFE